MGIKGAFSSGNVIFSGSGNIQIGTLASADGSGMAVSAANVKAFAVNADTGSAALAAGAYKASESRMLIGTAPASGDISVFGHEAHVKVVADASPATGFVAGSWGYLEIDTTGTVYIAAGVKAQADLPVSAVIASNGILAGVCIQSNTLAGTHTGKASALHLPTPLAGTWDYFAIIGSTTGFTDATGSVGAMQGRIKIKVGSTDGYIPFYATS